MDLSSPAFFQWYQWFRGLNQTAQTRRHLALFYHLTSKRPRFRRSGRSENNTGSSEIRQKLNNWIKITYFIGAWNVFSLAAILKFAVNVKSGTKISPSSPGAEGLLVFQWEDFGDEVEISLLLGFSNFQPFQNLHNFSVTILSFTPKFRITKCCSYFTIAFEHVISAFLNRRMWT